MIGAIIKTHFNKGGTLINVNVMDKQRVLEAHKDPRSYPDLVVRITGFTAYFSMLTPEFRQLVVDRILENQPDQNYYHGIHRTDSIRFSSVYSVHSVVH